MYDDSLDRGISSENQFETTMLSCGINIKRSNKNEDIQHHIDYWIRINDEWTSVDVKAPKKISRGDDDISLEYIFVEFKNVRGNDGWLYGNAKLIAFDLCDKFIIVFRDELLNLSQKLCDLDGEILRNPVLYKKYRRKSRPMEITCLIKTSDLLLIRHQVIRK